MKKNNSMISHLFFKLMPVQALIVAMGSINSIVDGAIAGRFIDSKTVGVIGLFAAITGILTSANSVMLGGSSVLSGRYMGAGDVEKTRGIFSLDIALSLIISGVVFLAMILFPGPIAVMCGADESLKHALELYIIGFSFGVIPQMLSTQIASFLQMERQTLRSYIGVAVMIVSNIILNITLVVVFNMGIFGLALSTSVCNWIYFFVLASYYFGGNTQLKFSIKNILWSDAAELIRIGAPGALLTLCLAFRELSLNRIALKYLGEDGLSARAALNMVTALFIALCLGGGSVIRMLASVSIGEEDRDSVKELIKLCFTKVILMCVGISVFVICISGWVAAIFFPDTSSQVYKYAYQYFLMLDISIPLVMVVQIQTNYLQAMKQNLCVHIFSIVDGYLSVVLPALILTPAIGAWGLWISIPIGITISAMVYPIYAIIYWKRIPRTFDEWLLFKEDFGVSDKDRMVINIHTIDDVSTTSEKTQVFCAEHGFNKKISFYCALCLEEMARNVVTYGFSKDSKKNYLDARIVCMDEEVLLRLKDDCPPFDPMEMAKNLGMEDPTTNIGIRMVTQISDEVNYQSILGLNVITIRFKKTMAMSG